MKKPARLGVSGTVPFSSWMWKNKVGLDGLFHIPYEINAAATFSSSQRALIHDSLEDLANDVGIIKFVPYDSAVDTNWITITSESGCWSYIGKTSLSSGGQPLNLQQNGCVYKGIIQHEFMHALGFSHEQSRPDRDDYVTINFENIQSGREGNFQKSSNVNSLGSPYDYGSVMHYGAYAFSSNGQPTIDANGNSIGQRNGASPTDVVQLRLLYQCASKINDMPSYIADPCTGDCKCSIGMTGCAGNDDSCHGSSICVDNTCSPPGTHAPTPAPTTPAPTTSAPTQAPTTSAPTQAPTTWAPTPAPTTQAPTPAPTTPAPTTQAPTPAPTTPAPTPAPTTPAPTPAPTEKFCLAEGLRGCDVDPCCDGLECQRAGRGKRRTYTCISGSTCKPSGLPCGSGSECCSGKCKGGRNPTCKE